MRSLVVFAPADALLAAGVVRALAQRGVSARPAPSLDAPGRPAALLFVVSPASAAGSELAELGRQALRMRFERSELAIVGALFGGADTPAFLADGPTCAVPLGDTGIAAVAAFFASGLRSDHVRGDVDSLATRSPTRAADGDTFLRDVRRWATHLRDDPETEQ